MANLTHVFDTVATPAGLKTLEVFLRTKIAVLVHRGYWTLRQDKAKVISYADIREFVIEN